MPVIVIALKDILVAPPPRQSVDLGSIPEAEAIDLIKKTYGFLSDAVEVEIRGSIAWITFPEEKATKTAQAMKDYDRGVKRAECGEYKKAIELFKRTLSVLPNHTEARRNLAMAYLEDGNLEEARNQLIDVLRVDPKDIWGYLLLGNTYSRYENDFDAAEPFYKKAYEVNPKDPYLLTNYAVLMLETDRPEEAIRMFDQAISADPKYPNSYLGLAHLYLRESRLDLVLSTLDRLFDESNSPDIRSKPVYEQARQLYLDANKVIAQQAHTSLMQFIRERQKLLEIKTGFPIEITQDDSLKMVSARTQMAWKHSRDHHRITYKNNRPEIIPHLLAHELEHISLEQEARESGKNKTFTSTAANREGAIRSIKDDIYRLRNLGYDEDKLTAVIIEMVSGLINQLFNCPLDMVIEDRLFHNYEMQRASQFVSLHATHQENLAILESKEIRRLTPRRIYLANVSMNCSYALFMDWIYGRRTEYSAPYKASDSYGVGKRLFEAFLETGKQFNPGVEYDLVEEFAKLLKLQDWFEFQPDKDPSEVAGKGGPTNPDLLKTKEPATIMYLLSALQRFDNISMDDVRAISFEIGLLGTTGIDYTKGDRRYSLKSAPGEQFSGLQLLAMMYVGFQKIDPSLNTGVDFRDAYQIALQMHKQEP